MKDIIIKNIKYDNLEKALELVKDVFMEFDAPDYSEDGVSEFTENILKDKKYTDRFKTGDLKMIDAFHNNKLIGALAISASNHLSLLFVHRDYQRKGVATKLFNEVHQRLKLKDADKITLNSSPYAVPFYKKIGFISTDVEHVVSGIRYTPMEFILEQSG